MVAGSLWRVRGRTAVDRRRAGVRAAANPGARWSTKTPGGCASVESGEGKPLADAGDCFAGVFASEFRLGASDPITPAAFHEE
jgi:hypothetical protein